MNNPSKSKVAAIEKTQCDNSPFCAVIRMCPKKAVARQGSFFSGGKPEIDSDLCAGCGICVQYCPHSAVSMAEA